MLRKSILLLLLVLLTTTSCLNESPSTTSQHVAEKAAPPSAAPAPTPLFPSFADVVEKVRPSVINIYTRTRVRTNRYLVTPGHRLVPEERQRESLGSGFIIGADGYALTNFHVIDGANQIEIRLLDERRFKAHVIGVDKKTDIALIKIDGAKKLPALEFADSEALRVGEWVIAIGNPVGLTSTVTAGIASAIGRRDLPIGGDLRYQDFIQTDASINPGNSGGPLIDVRGRVVGINSAVHSSAQGIGFAIPINIAKQLLPRLKKGGQVQRAWLGIYVDDIPKALRPEIGLPPSGGALVREIIHGGPAHQAKLKPGDVILEAGGEKIESAD